VLPPEIPGAGINNQELDDDNSSSSDSDNVMEVLELEHFSAMLQKSQQVAVQAQTWVPSRLLGLLLLAAAFHAARLCCSEVTA
jgi:hypothetical protein